MFQGTWKLPPPAQPASWSPGMLLQWQSDTTGSLTVKQVRASCSGSCRPADLVWGYQKATANSTDSLTAADKNPSLWDLCGMFKEDCRIQGLFMQESKLSSSAPCKKEHLEHSSHFRGGSVCIFNFSLGWTEKNWRKIHWYQHHLLFNLMHLRLSCFFMIENVYLRRSITFFFLHVILFRWKQPCTGVYSAWHRVHCYHHWPQTWRGLHYHRVCCNWSWRQPCQQQASYCHLQNRWDLSIW